MTIRGFFFRFILSALCLLLLSAGAVFLLDPFYHYHAPIPPLKKVLKDKEYQCIGSLRNFDYDAVLAGSSVAENFNDRAFDHAFGITLVKAIRASGTTADLHYYLQEGFSARQERGSAISHVFYNIDIAALYASPETTFEETGQPMYLYNANPFDDIEYLWNKDVLLEKIPVELADSFLTDYDEGTSYNWAKWKTFSREQMLKAYTPSEEIAPMKPETADEELLEKNLGMLKGLVSAHPETQFVFYFPPYSLLWWDEAYRAGELERDLYGKKKAMETLLAFPNVRIFDFQEDEEVILNPDNYMDTLHFSAEITEQLFQTLSDKRPADIRGNGYEIQLRDGPHTGTEGLRAEETALGQQRVFTTENTGNAGHARTEGLRAEETASGEQRASATEITGNAGQINSGKEQEPERIYRTPEECRKQMRELVNRIEEEEMKKYYF